MHNLTCYNGGLCAGRAGLRVEEVLQLSLLLLEQVRVRPRLQRVHLRQPGSHAVKTKNSYFWALSEEVMISIRIRYKYSIIFEYDTVLILGIIRRSLRIERKIRER